MAQRESQKPFERHKKLAQNQKIRSEFVKKEVLTDPGTRKTKGSISTSAHKTDVDRILDRMCKFVKENERYPYQRDWKFIAKNEGYPSVYWIKKHIGWMTIKRMLKEMFPLYSKSKKKIITQGIQFFELYHKLPTSPEWERFRKENPGIVSKQLISDEFGGWANFLKVLFDRVKLEDKELSKKILKEFRDVVYSTCAVPDNKYWDELYRKGVVTVPSEIVSRIFGSFKNLLEQSGITKKEIVVLQIKVFLEKGHKLTVREWNKYVPKYGFMRYDLIVYYFGGFGKLIRFGLKSDLLTPELLGGKLYRIYVYTDEESILSALRKGTELLGHVPTISEWVKLVDQVQFLPSYSQVIVRFGSWTRALYRAGLVEDVWPTIRDK